MKTHINFLICSFFLIPSHALHAAHKNTTVDFALQQIEKAAPAIKDMSAYLGAQQLVSSLPQPRVSILTREGITVAIVLFTGMTDAAKKNLFAYAQEKLASLGQTALYGLGAGLGIDLIQPGKSNSYGLYLKPIISSSAGLIGMALASTVIPQPLIAGAVATTCQGMATSCGTELAKRLAAAPTTKALVHKTKKAEQAVIRNSLILLATLTLIMAIPLIIMYIPNIARTFIDPDSSTVAVISAGTSAVLQQLDKPLMYQKSAEIGKAFGAQARNQLKEATKQVNWLWDTTLDTFTTLLLPKFEVITPETFHDIL